jgi:predicted nucleotide-binding protein
VFRDAHDDAISLLRAELRRVEDEHLRAILEDVLELRALSYDACIRAQLPSGQFASRDSLAINQGIRSAPHQEVIAQVVALRSPFQAADKLALLCHRAARHLARIGGEVAPTGAHARTAKRVVIGHGQSPLWRELKDFIADRLKLAWDEFNRVAVAAVATTDRLQQMVESSTLALLVATAEEEGADRTFGARQNVIHEIGLFQGHLGFSRAIVLLEDGCEEFSNIHGLGQIRFPRGNIAACFEEVRRVLEREGVLPGDS